jgi:hypothetical protein
LKYNWVTNDGEEYKASDSFEFMDALALSLARAVLEQTFKVVLPN